MRNFSPRITMQYHPTLRSLVDHGPNRGLQLSRQNGIADTSTNLHSYDIKLPSYWGKRVGPTFRGGYVYVVEHFPSIRPATTEDLKCTHKFINLWPCTKRPDSSRFHHDRASCCAAQELVQDNDSSLERNKHSRSSGSTTIDVSPGVLVNPTAVDQMGQGGGVGLILRPFTQKSDTKNAIWFIIVHNYCCTCDSSKSAWSWPSIDRFVVLSTVTNSS